MKLALERARVQPQEVSFVEAHGTGTIVGDPLEVAAIQKAYGSIVREKKLIIGSVKTNIGHTESCSGIAGIMKTVLCMQNENIPIHLNFKKLNPDIHLDSIPAEIPLTSLDWKRCKRTPRLAGVSSFGITGTNGHAIIQEPYQEDGARDTDIKSTYPKHFLKVSAKCSSALAALKDEMRSFLGSEKESLLDAVFTANTGQGDYLYRAFAVGRDKCELMECLSQDTKLELAHTVPKACFLFTGQGSQYPGMARGVYEGSLLFRLIFDRCDSMVQERCSFSMKEVLWGGSSHLLKRSLYSQTCLFCVEYSLTELWKSWGVTPQCVLGHSLGEFAAACSAGILSFEDALTLVVTRSQLTDALPCGQMLVVREGQKAVLEFLNLLESKKEGLWLDVAAVNAPDQTVLAGNEESTLEFEEICRNNGISAHILDASHAFHSRLMDPMLNACRDIAKTLRYSDPSCTFISGMEGRALEKGECTAEYWVQHIRKSVQFLQASKAALLDSACDVFLEIGPHSVLSALLLTNADAIGAPGTPSCIPSLRRKENDWTTIFNSLGKLYMSGVDVKWEGFHQFSKGKKVTLPFYPFQKKKFELSLTNNRPRPFHPLVGCQVANPSEAKMFQSTLDLDSTPFLKDHVIGSTCLFPGAGFLEMCLVAGHAGQSCLEGSYQHPTNPIAILDFQIEAPMALQEDHGKHVQILISGDDGQQRISIHSRLDLEQNTSKWIRQVSGTFSPYVHFSKYEEICLKSMDLNSAMGRCGIQLDIGDKSYASLAKHGYKFGPTFQTLRDGWRNEAKTEILCKGFTSCYSISYALHPVVVDALFQSIMILNASQHLSPANETGTGGNVFVPVSIEKFIWFGHLRTEDFYVHCKVLEEQQQTLSILYDFEGNRLAAMIGALLIETSVSSIMINLQSQKSVFPAMYEDCWKSQLGQNDMRIPLAVADTLTSDKNIQIQYGPLVSKFNKSSGENLEVYRKINELCLNFMIKALRILGWDIEKPGDIFQLADLQLKLGVKPEMDKFLRYILLELVEESFLELVIDDPRNLQRMEFKVKKSLPELKLVEERSLNLLKDEALQAVDEVRYVSRVEVLGPILQGSRSVLPILFPENLKDGELGPATGFYRNSEMIKRMFGLSSVLTEPYCRNVNEFLKEAKGGAVLRILEIGAGTGSFTKEMMPYFVADHSCYEYTYTDISAVFFSKAEELFKDSKMRKIFKTLNIEVDPMAQGFIPQHYDLILASFVLHATKDLKETLENVRKLLRPTGKVMITELIEPLRPVNILFGAVDGFSRFTDFDLRPHHCGISQAKWEEVLLQCGFAGVATYPCYNDHTIYIHCGISPNKKAESSLLMNQQPATVAPAWLIFSNNQDNRYYFHSKLSEELGKKVFMVQEVQNPCGECDSVNGITTASGNIIRIRIDEPTDLLSAFATIVPDDGSVQLEGILFLWGLETEENDAQCAKTFLTLCQILLRYAFPREHRPPKLIVATASQTIVTDGDVSESPFPSILWGMTKALLNENPAISCKCIDLHNSIELETVYKEIFIDDNECSVAYRDNRRYVLRCCPFKPDSNTKPIPIPKAERYKLILPTSNSINDLRFAPADSIQLGDNEVEIQVKAYSMNFRDVLVVLKPSEEFEDIGTVGYDFSGVVTAVGVKVTKRKVGDEVIGFNMHGEPLASHQNVDEDMLIPVPSNLTLEDAAALPAVLATSYVCLIKMAKITKEDTVLIHTGSGGVGLCSIRVAQKIGCKIVTTAGTARKRAFLKNPGVRYVFNSRNTNYEHDIREALGGQGVDVVLNSLTSEGFKEATLAVCNPDARFIEMSKLNVWNNEDVAALRPDVKYDIVDLTKSTKEEWLDYLGQVKSYTEETQLKPLPYVRFHAQDIRGALSFLQKAKHIGKIVCAMPEPLGSSGVSGWKNTCFNDRSTYLITGGLGGIGLEVAKWMVGSGARHVVLVGRNPPGEYANSVIDALNSVENGGNVQTLQCDVGDYIQCKAMLEEISRPGRNLPMLRGIMHAAGVLSDGSYDDQTWEKYSAAFNPKVNGGWNLHQLTLDYPLQHFVMFSSMAALLGSIGQSNHCSANCFLDALARYRNSMGLPASTINWGQWGQTGVAINVDVSWVKPFSTIQAISALEVTLRGQNVQVAVGEADIAYVRKQLHCSKRYLEDLKENNDSKKIFGSEADGEAFWREYDATKGTNGKIDLVRKYLGTIIRTILRLDEEETIDPNTNFQDLGMDSLMLIEMKNNLQAILGSRAKISIGTLKDCKTINQASARLVELISGEDTLHPPTRELQMLIREDSQLSADIVPPENGIRGTCKASEIKTVLVTGVTGNFGPYLLREIAKRQHIQKIYCLIRQTVSSSPTERLQNVLKDKKLDTDLPMGKLVCVRGNVTEDKLGMDASIYERLATEVDAVYNLAVRADIQQYYRKARASDRDSRTVNVYGTIRILEFACAKKLKYVFHASTMGAGIRVDDEDQVAEDWPDIREFDHAPNMAYPISKFICDLLMAQAVGRGIPCKVFRFPYMGVDSHTGGGIDVLGSHLILRMLAYLYIGAMPAVALPFTILPIDICASIGTNLAFDDNAEIGIYNVANPYANDEQELEDFAGEDFGHPVEIMDPDNFMDRVEKMDNAEDIIAMAKYTARRRKDDTREHLENHVPAVGVVWLRKKDIFWSKKLRALIPDYPNFCKSSLELLKTDLRFAKETGVFNKVGLK
jgi:acyl transferase domain-containing protein/NADPH:quinone reductase-like Zn-dependent oxidoreductase/thioester reductase-like protein/NADP-dependent 3-hydroxy acid dehydrogenase YdfG/SAM-dependent methyltransferase/acyl carrier protein